MRTSNRSLNLLTGSDDCAQCNANSVCLNKDDVVTCTCKMGYAGNGFSCEGEASCRRNVRRYVRANVLQLRMKYRTFISRRGNMAEWLEFGPEM